MSEFQRVMDDLARLRDFLVAVSHAARHQQRYDVSKIRFKGAQYVASRMQEIRREVGR